jgi:hypothetical protein
MSTKLIVRRKLKGLPKTTELEIGDLINLNHKHDWYIVSGMGCVNLRYGTFIHIDVLRKYAVTDYIPYSCYDIIIEEKVK